MSENLMDSVAPHLVAPVSRDQLEIASDTDGGVEASIITILNITILFAADDAE